MSNHPNAIFFQNGYALIATEGGMIETCMLKEGNYVRIDDRRQYPQLCAGAARTGNTLIYNDEGTLARDCRAKLYKTREGFDRAVDRIVMDFGIDEETVTELNRQSQAYWDELDRKGW